VGLFVKSDGTYRFRPGDAQGVIVRKVHPEWEETLQRFIRDYCCIGATAAAATTTAVAEEQDANGEGVHLANSAAAKATTRYPSPPPDAPRTDGNTAISRIINNQDAAADSAAATARSNEGSDPSSSRGGCSGSTGTKANNSFRVVENSVSHGARVVTVEEVAPEQPPPASPLIEKDLFGANDESNSQFVSSAGDDDGPDRNCDDGGRLGKLASSSSTTSPPAADAGLPRDLENKLWAFLNAHSGKTTVTANGFQYFMCPIWSRFSGAGSDLQRKNDAFIKKLRHHPLLAVVIEVQQTNFNGDSREWKDGLKQEVAYNQWTMQACRDAGVPLVRLNDTESNGTRVQSLFSGVKTSRNGTVVWRPVAGLIVQNVDPAWQSFFDDLVRQLHPAPSLSLGVPDSLRRPSTFPTPPATDDEGRLLQSRGTGEADSTRVSPKTSATSAAAASPSLAPTLWPGKILSPRRVSLLSQNASASSTSTAPLPLRLDLSPSGEAGVPPSPLVTSNHRFRDNDDDDCCDLDSDCFEWIRV